MTWDERTIIWRFHHLKVVERIIGGNVIGTQGTPVEVLGKRIDVRFFPELWTVRDEITSRSKLGADGHGMDPERGIGVMQWAMATLPVPITHYPLPIHRPSPIRPSPIAHCPSPISPFKVSDVDSIVRRRSELAASAPGVASRR